MRTPVGEEQDESVSTPAARAAAMGTVHLRAFRAIGAF
jgi:hypothetical protein